MRPPRWIPLGTITPYCELHVHDREGPKDEERGDELRAIEFERITGGKAFDVSVPWFTGLLRDLGQA